MRCLETVDSVSKWGLHSMTLRPITTWGVREWGVRCRLGVAGDAEVSASSCHRNHSRGRNRVRHQSRVHRL